jgi:regulation of enolase protein 1 (concanavalin A-like superfamily)
MTNRGKRCAPAAIETLERRMLMAGDGAVRIDVGGASPFTDSLGRVWSADANYTGGTPSTGSFSVANTVDDRLFYTRRWGNFSYNIPLAANAYTLNLYFAEPVITSVGWRVFNASAEGQPILSNFDLFATAGYHNALVKSFPIAVADGALNLKFTTIKNSPILSAIEVVPVNAAPQVPTAPTGLTATATSTSSVHLSWNQAAFPAATSFIVERLGPADSDYAVIGSPTAQVFDDIGLTPGTTYAYRVRAVGTAGTSDASTAVNVTPWQALPAPWVDADIGSVGKAGGVTVTGAGAFSVSGGGADVWGAADAFNFVYQPLVGDGTIVARVVSQQNTNGWAKSGVMIRESLASSSRFAIAAMTPSNGATFQRRLTTGVTPSSSTTSAGKGSWVKLVRAGGQISAYVSPDGQAWKLIGTTTLTMANNVFVGLFVCAHDNSKLNASVFDNVLVTANGVASSAWTAGTPAPITRWEANTFTDGQKLYMFGGFYNHAVQATTRCDVYDPATDTWTQLPTTMPIAVTHAGVAVVDGVVYFAGGYVGDWAKAPGTNRVMAYDLASGTWSNLPSLPDARVAGGLVAIGRVLHFFGGMNTQRTADLADHWALDLDNLSAGWVSLAPMPNPRNHLGYAAVNGIVYALGGLHVMNEETGQDAEVDAYDPVTDTWAQVASLPMPWSHFHTSTFVVNGKIGIVGGQTDGNDDGTYVPNIAEYDPTADAWQMLPPLPEARQATSAEWINGQLVVVGGATQGGGEGYPQQQVWINNQLTL